MAEVNSTGNRVKAGDGSKINLGIINGLDAKEVGEIIAKAKEEILKQITTSGSNIMSDIAITQNNATAQLSNIIRNKLCELVGNINDDLIQTESNIKNAIQDNFNNLKRDLTPLVTGIKQDIISVKEDIDKTAKQSDERQKALFERLSRRYEYYQQKAENNYFILLEKIKALESDYKPDYKIEFMQGMECIEEADFESATRFFDKVVQQNDLRSKAYFGLALAIRKVQLIWDYNRDQRQPILHDYSDERKLFTQNNPDYNLALKYAENDIALTKKYKELAERIDKALENYWRYYRMEDMSQENMDSLGRDCFICVKVTDSKTGKETADCDWIKDSGLYKKLKDKKIRPFFSQIDISEGTLGEVYEAKIFYALNKAQCMILVCSNEADLSTPWVKNEYTRFLNKMKVVQKDLPQKRLIIICNDAFLDPQSLGLLYGQTQYKRSEKSVDEIVDIIKKKVDEISGCTTPNIRYCSRCGAPYGVGFDKCARSGCNGKIVDALTYANMLNTRNNATIQALKREQSDLKSRIKRFENEFESMLTERVKSEEEKLKKEKKQLRVNQEELERKMKEVDAEKRRIQTENEKTRKIQDGLEAEMAALIVEKRNVKLEQANITSEKQKLTDDRKILEAEKQRLSDASQSNAQAPIKSTAIENYDETEFYVVGTTLVKYNGSASKVVIPEGVTYIADYSFSDCGDFLKEVKLPSSWENMGDEALANCRVTLDITALSPSKKEKIKQMKGK